MIAVFLVLDIAFAPIFAQEPVFAQEIVTAQSGVAATNVLQNAAPAVEPMKPGVMDASSTAKAMAAESGVAATNVPQNTAPAVEPVKPGVMDASATAKAMAAESGVAATNAPQNTAPAAEPGVVRVPYIPESVKNEIEEEIKKEVLAQAHGERWGDPGALPGWLSRISWDGEFRLRFQRDSFPPGNALPAQYNPSGLTLISNTTDTHDYMRVVARLGMKAQLSDYTFVAMQVGTGNTNAPPTSNQTMGNGFSNYNMVLNRAYIQSDPYRWLEFVGGKMPNPWLYTNLVWDANVNFEGVAAHLKPKISERWYGFLTAGAFPYQDVQGSNTNLANSKWLYGSQLGAAWVAQDSSSAQFGAALYDFSHVEGIPNTMAGLHTYDSTAAVDMQKGNSLMYVNAVGDPLLYGLASKFREFDITAKMDWANFDPVHVRLTGDYVKNLGYNQAEIEQRTGLVAPTPEIIGYQAELMVGMPQIRRRGEWQASVAYKYLQRDAVLDALTDQDFHLGGTNAKGFDIKVSFGVDKNTWMTVRWISTDQIDGAPLSIDTLMVDLNARF